MFLQDQVSMMPNGSPQAAIEILLMPDASGKQQIRLNHHLAQGWPAAIQLLLSALQIAIAADLDAQRKPPLITPATLHPRLHPPVR